MIGEAARALPPDIAEQHGQIEWHKLRAMRNVVVHEYFGARLETVWETVRNDLPPLVPRLRAILDDSG